MCRCPHIWSLGFALLKPQAQLMVWDSLAKPKRFDPEYGEKECGDCGNYWRRNDYDLHCPFCDFIAECERRDNMR